MSITRARSFLEKSGCGWIVSIGLGLVVVFGLFTYLGSGRAQQNQTPPEMLKPVATIGTHGVTTVAVDRHFEAQSGQLNVEGGAPVELAALIYGQELDALLQQAAQMELASRRGIKISDDDVAHWAGANFDAQLQQEKFNLQIQGKIKPTATEAEIQGVLEKELGGSVAAMRTKRIEEIKKRMEDDPVAQGDITAAVIGQKLMDSYSAQVQLSDEQLKKDQVKTVFKRISFKINPDYKQMTMLDVKQKEEALTGKASKVLAEIKGGLSFEAAMDKYSDDPAPASGKKKSDSTVNLERATLDYDRDYAPLLDLKPGDVSPVIPHSMGPYGEFLIFKAIKIDTKLPADFETNKTNYRKNRISQIATSKIFADMKQLTAEDSVKWQSEGFKVLHRWFKVYDDADLLKDPAKRLAEIEKVYKDAKKVAEEPDSLGLKPATFAYFASLDRVYKAASPDKKKTLQEDWAEAADLALQSTENTDLRLELVQVDLDLKKLDEAKDQLLSAAGGLVGTSEDAFRRYKKIQELRAKLVAAGVSAKDLKQLDDSQKFWASDAVESLKGEAEANTDYSEMGWTKFGEIDKQAEKLKALGLIQASDVVAIQETKKKWKEEAVKDLKTQAETNTKYDESGRAEFASINRRLEKLKEIQAIKPEDFKAIETLQTKWKLAKAKYDEDQAKERKKRDEEAKKAAEDAKKNAKPKTPSSTDLGKIGG